MSKKILFQAIHFSLTVLIQTIQFSMSIVFVYKQLNVKTIPFQTIQFSINMQFNCHAVLFPAIHFNKSTQFNSIWSMGRTASGATTSGQSGPGSDSNEVVLRIPQSSCITGTSPSDCLVSYPGHSLYSTA